MESRSGCLRNVLIGCLGLIGVVVLVALVVAGLAAVNVSRKDVVEREVSAPAEALEQTAAAPAGGEVVTVKTEGRVILDLGHGEFVIKPAAPGEGIVVKARFDQSSYALHESFEVLPDSTWVYRVEYRRTIGGLQAIAQAIMSRGTPSRVEVYLAPDLPLTLDLAVRQGGAEVDLGGLWLRDASIAWHQGGMDLKFSEPLRDPIGRLHLHGSMGGVNVGRVGNASPAVLDVSCRMGGAELDMRGPWRGDCRASFRARMGGISVRVPEELDVRDAAADTLLLATTTRETPAMVLWVTKDANMGEVEVQRR